MAKIEESPLPQLYARWMRDFLGAPLPVEVRTVCHDCRMIKPREVPCKSDVLFHPNTKCCTFMPEVPNYLVGSLLADDSPESAAGKKVFEEGALSRGVINPLGVFPTPEYSMLYRFNQKNFGQREGLRCPYYMVEAGGLCGMWKHRNGRCSTWFCTHERGSVSVLFWKYLDRLLAAVENSLAKWCLLKIDLGSLALIELIPASGDPVRGSRVVWGKWVDREREFFMECARAVEALDWQQVLDITGPETHVFARLAMDSFRSLQAPVIPTLLKCGPWNAEPVLNGHMRVWTFSVFDPIEVESKLLNALYMFDGTRPTEEVAAAIETETGIRIDAALLQKLYDVRVLVEG